MKFEDIKRIGHTIYRNEENGTNFICDINTANIEYLILRDILNNSRYNVDSKTEFEEKLFLYYNNPGKYPIPTDRKYEILKEEDFQWSDGEMCICLVTDIPYDVYLAL